MIEWTWILILPNVSYARSNLPYPSKCRLLAPSDQDESSDQKKTGSKSLDIPTIPCPLTGYRRSLDVYIQANGLLVPTTTLQIQALFACFKDTKTEVSNLITFMMKHDPYASQVFVCGWHPVNVNILASG